MIEIAGLTATGEDDAGRTYYKKVKGRIVQKSQYNDQQYQIKGLEGYWESTTILQIGRVYEMALTAKMKTGPNARPGSHYLDIRSATLDESIPVEAPANHGAKNGGSSSQDEFRRSKEEMRWTESYSMAAQLAAKAGAKADLEAFIVGWAGWFYNELASQGGDRVPTQPVEYEEPEEPEMLPPEDEEDDDQSLPF